MPPTVFVLLPDHGTEGLGEPIAVFTTRMEAEAAKALMDGLYSSVRLVEVPLWPNLPRKTR